MLKILMMIRGNAFTQRGGDTIVLERLSEELQRLGHEVTADHEAAEDPSRFDIAHLYNFATNVVTEAQARRCVSKGARFVVTTLYEDWPLFVRQMVFQELKLKAYVDSGQSPETWERLKTTSLPDPKAAIQDNTFTANAAEILISSGFNESVSLRRDYPLARSIEICRFGNQFGGKSDGGELFRKHTGVTDYLLCVGRLENRKNQLTLLKAIEDWPQTAVFLCGGFTYIPEYEALCRAFKRKGKNIFLGRLPAEVVASAYEGAAAHVLPSWYELPGLVSIEAAARGTPVVVADYGTIRDYLGDDAHYCLPDDPESIEKAIDRARNSGKSSKLRERVQGYTWANTAKRMVELYERALARERGLQAPEPQAVSPGRPPSKKALIQDRLKPRL